MSKEVDFKLELKQLLERHHAAIGFKCATCSDLHGVYGEQIVVSLDGDCGKDTPLAEGYWVNSEDLEAPLDPNNLPTYADPHKVALLKKGVEVLENLIELLAAPDNGNLYFALETCRLELAIACNQSFI